MKTTALIFSAALAALAPLTADAGNGNGNGNGKGPKKFKNDNEVVRKAPDVVRVPDVIVGSQAVAAQQGVGHCPPGLAKKNPPCVPPGLAKKDGQYDDDFEWYGDRDRYRDRYEDGYYDRHPYRVGDRIYGDYQYVRYPERYGLDPNYDYYRVGDNFYRVNRESNEVLDFLGALYRVLK